MKYVFLLCLLLAACAATNLKSADVYRAVPELKQTDYAEAHTNLLEESHFRVGDDFGTIYVLKSADIAKDYAESVGPRLGGYMFAHKNLAIEFQGSVPLDRAKKMEETIKNRL